jgi:hypothetical protein
MNTNRKIQRIQTRIKRNHERIDKMRRDRLNLPFVHFVMLMPFMTTATIQSLVLIPPPKKFCKRDVPDTLQMVTFGLLTELQQAPKDNDYLRTCCALVSVLTGVDEKVVASRRAYDVLGIVNMIQSEMARIGKLFNSLQTDKTSDEMAAGIDKLEFGTFGIVDWYAKRMGIIDHEEVFNTPWARIYQCMRIDHEQGEFEKRYRKVIENRSKMKR